MEFESTEERNNRIAQERKYDLVTPVPERDWPTMAQVQADYPYLCEEEQVWALEALIHKAREEQEQ